MHGSRLNRVAPPPPLFLISLLAAVLSVAGCAREQPRSQAAEQQLTVFAAASLRDAFSALSAPFQARHGQARLTFNFAGSQELRAQIEHGAPADVFASADTKHMDALVRAGRVQGAVLFARNEPVLAVARESASAVRSLADLPTLERIVLGAPDVPIGRYTQHILERAATVFGADFPARVDAKVVSRELSVRQVLAKVSLGEAQAGIVYRSDALSAADKVAAVSIAPELNVVADYPIGIVADAAHPTLARAWIELVRSPEGQEALTAAGFLAPDEPRP